MKMVNVVCPSGAVERLTAEHAAYIRHMKAVWEECSSLEAMAALMKKWGVSRPAFAVDAEARSRSKRF